jgi:hypothetical protein
MPLTVPHEVATGARPATAASMVEERGEMADLKMQIARRRG